MSKFAKMTATAMGLLFLIGNVHAVELKVLCAYGMQTVIEELAPKFERASGHTLALAFATGGATVKRAQDGESIDVVISLRDGIDGLAKDSKVVTGSVSALASAGISVAIRKGAQKPDISTADTLKRALLAAKSVTYLNPTDGGASGIHFAKVLEKLGIAGEMKSKTMLAPKASAIGPMVASGEAELGILQYQLLFAVPGIDIAGPLPGELQNTTVFSAAIVTSSKSVDAAKALIGFLRTPEADAVIRAKGMDPVSRQ